MEKHRRGIRRERLNKRISNRNLFDNSIDDSVDKLSFGVGREEVGGRAVHERVEWSEHVRHIGVGAGWRGLVGHAIAARHTAHRCQCGHGATAHSVLQVFGQQWTLCTQLVGGAAERIAHGQRHIVVLLLVTIGSTTHVQRCQIGVLLCSGIDQARKQSI